MFTLTLIPTKLEAVCAVAAEPLIIDGVPPGARIVVIDVGVGFNGVRRRTIPRPIELLGAAIVRVMLRAAKSALLAVPAILAGSEIRLDAAGRFAGL